jgi:hypothetical protein
MKLLVTKHSFITRKRTSWQVPQADHTQISFQNWMVGLPGILQWRIECIGVAAMLNSYWGGAQFESQEDVGYPEVFHDYLSHSRQSYRMIPQLDDDHFLPNPFGTIIHLSSIH